MKKFDKTIHRSISARSRIMAIAFTWLACWLLSFSVNAQAIIGTGTATTNGSTPDPVERYYNYEHFQTVYTAAELTAAGIPAGNSITAIGYSISQSASSLSNFTISIGNTSQTIADPYISTGLVVVKPAFTYVPVVQAAGSFDMITLTTPFLWNGTSNIVVETCTGSNPFVTPYGGLRVTTAPVTGATRYNRLDGSSNCGSTTTDNTTSRPNIRFDHTFINNCSGLPTPGNTISSLSTVCPGGSFTLSLQNVANGYSYQWQSADDAAFSVNLTNLGTASTQVTSLASGSKYYRAYVTCSFSGQSDYSNPVQVSAGLTPACYCTASATTCDEAINAFTFNTISNTSGCSGGYANNSAQSTTVVKGSTYPASVTTNLYYSLDAVDFYIDYNQNGVFDVPSEKTSLTYTGSNGVFTGNVTVPVGALTGSTILRARIWYSTLTGPCGNASYGEVEDYTINIVPPAPCVDPPTAGSATASSTSFCETASPTIALDLTGNSIGVGQTYQWQESFDDLIYINIGPVSSTTPYSVNPTTTTYYRCVVTCGTSSVESASILVTANPTPVAGTISGPSTLSVGGAPGSYEATGNTPTFIWQASTSISGPFTDIAGTANINPIDLFANSAGTFYIQLSASENGCTSVTSNILTVTATIVNDNVCGALPIVIGSNGPYNNVGATSETGEPVPPQNNCNSQSDWCAFQTAGTVANNTLWYTFTVPVGGSGRYLIRAAGWDSELAIYSAADCNAVTSGGATLLQANDDGFPNANSNFGSQLISHCLVPGQTYFVQLDGYGTTTFNNIIIDVIDEGPADPSFTGLPANACVASSTPIALTPAVAGGTFSGPGVVGNTFIPSTAGVGTWSVTYTLGGNDVCYSSSQSITVDPIVATYYADVDGDSYGNPASSIQSCSLTPPVGYVADNTDCNDASPAVNPGATEVCNLIDDNCNGSVDEGYDVDGDTYFTCTGDCNDNDPAINPAATEVCNGIDDNCNGLNDDGLTFVTYYADADGDTYGNPNVSQSTCDGAPLGYVLDNTDCNDAVATANPAGLELCNGIDDDCDGLTDEFTEPNAGAISGPAVQCVPVVTGSATFSIAPVPYATSYTWSLPVGMSIISGQGTNSVFVSWTPLAVSNGIIGSLTVTASNACGSGAPSSVAIDINYTPPVTPPSISGASRVCPGEEASLYSISTVARATSYTWSVPAGMNLLSGQGSNVATISAGAGYTGGVMTITANNACGSSPVRIKNMGLNTPGVPAAISGAASGVCGLTGVVYSTAGTPAATSYLWSVPAGATIVSGQGSTSISVDFSGGFTGGPITVSGTNLCGNGAARSLSVAGAPGLPGVISGPTAICPNQAGVIYQINTVTGADTYTWTVPGGAVITSGQGTKIITVTYGPAPATGQIVTVKASNPCGTSSTRVLSGITIAFTNCLRIGAGSSNTTMEVYPNPATDRINVSFTAAVAANYTLKMQDLAGRVVYAEQGAAIEGNNMKEISLDQLAGGIYMVVLESNGVTQQVRLVVE